MNSEPDYSFRNVFNSELISLLNNLHSGHVELFKSAVTRLRTMDPRTSELLINEIKPVLTHPDPERRCDSIELLLLINTTGTIYFVLPLLNDPVDYVRNCVLQEIEFNGYYDRGIVSYMMNSLKADKNNDVRYRAATLLGKIRDPIARPVLEWAQANDHGENYEGDTVSARASWALSHLE